MARGDEKLSELATQIARMKSEGRPLFASSVPKKEPKPREAKQAASKSPAIRPELQTVLGMVTRAADAMNARGDQIASAERRSRELESRLETAERRVGELEEKLRAATDEVQREKARAEDLKGRSADLIEKTQAMLNDASDRLVEAEARAEQAEENFAILRSAVTDRLGS